MKYKVGDVFRRRELVDGEHRNRIVRIQSIDPKAYALMGKIEFNIIGIGRHRVLSLSVDMFEDRYSKIADPNKIWKELNQ